MAVLYPIRAVAKLTGLSVDTLRAWERRYRAVVPRRDERGRAYDQTQVERLRLLRRVVDRGHAIGSVATMPDEDLRELVGTTATKTGSALLCRVVEAIEGFDYVTANDELGRLAALLPVSDLVNQVALPLMRTVGDRWREGSLTVAQEHMTSALLRNLLGSLMRLPRTGNESTRIMFTTLAGEHHEFGILAGAMLAAGAGVAPVYLGPNLPAKEIVYAARRSGSRAVVIGTSTVQPHYSSEVRTLAESLPSGVELWLGGPAASELADGHSSTRVLALPAVEELVEHYRRVGGGY